MNFTKIEKPAAVCLATALLTLVFASAAAAEFTAKDDEIVVAPHQDVQVITPGLLLANDDPGTPPANLIIKEYSLPLHGGLSAGFYYTPGDDFWTVGSDSFTYTVADGAYPEGETSTATVFLVAGYHSDVEVDVDFESGLVDPDLLLVGTDIEVTEQAAISDEKGLRVSVDTSSSEAYLSDLQHGPTTNGSGSDDVCVEEPTGEGLGMPEGSSADVITAGEALLGREALRVTLHKSLQGGLGVLAEIMDDTGGAHTVPAGGVPHPLAGGPHALHVHWWTGPGYGGMRLLVDGIHVGEVADIDNAESSMDEHHFGIMNLDPPGSATLHFDDVEVWSGVWQAAFDSIRLDGFEAGPAIQWSNAATTDLAVTRDAALTGSWGLEVDLDSAGERFLVDDSPAGLSRYNARFELDVNSLTIGPVEDFVLLEGSQEDGAPAGMSHVQVGIGSVVGGNWLWALHQDLGSGLQTQTPWFHIGHGRHVVELQWRAATLPTGSNGALTLRVDGQPVGELTGLANGGYVVESVRFGAEGVDQRTSGTFYLDGFESWVRSPPQILRDGFEEGLGSWTNESTTSLAVSQDAALLGNWGVEVDLDGAGSRFLLDDSPMAEKRYKVRFRLDPNSIVMAENDEFLLLAASDEDGAPTDRLHLQLKLRYLNGAHHLRVRYKNLATGFVATTDLIPVADTEQVVELAWRAASNPGVANGKVRFRIDGVLADELVGLANDGDVIESVRLGVKGVDAGTSGTLYVDSFRSWR